MYKLGDKVDVVSPHIVVKGHMCYHTLKECLKMTKGMRVNDASLIALHYTLTIIDIVDMGKGKKGFIGYKPLNEIHTEFILGHCNYPTYSDKKESEYCWTVYKIGLSSNEKRKPNVAQFEDVRLIKKWTQEGKRTNKVLRNMCYLT